MCVDFTQFNKITPKIDSPFPNIERLIHTIGKKKPKYFTTIDLPKIFHQIKIYSANRRNLAFVTPEEETFHETTLWTEEISNNIPEINSKCRKRSDRTRIIAAFHWWYRCNNNNPRKNCGNNKRTVKTICREKYNSQQGEMWSIEARSRIRRVQIVSKRNSSQQKLEKVHIRNKNTNK